MVHLKSAKSVKFSLNLEVGFPVFDLMIKNVTTVSLMTEEVGHTLVLPKIFS